MEKDTYIILVNYNGIKDTINCIKSIKKNEKILNYKIIVIDNASTDDSVEKLRNFEGIIFLESKENLGFAKGNNLGIKYALEHDCKSVILLNNDTEIEKNALSALDKIAYEHEDVGITGSRIMYYDNKNLVNYCGGYIDWRKAVSIHEGEKQKYLGDNIEFRYTDFITGCCMLIKRDVLQKVGLLPEEYFMYFEDTDYCVNALHSGYKLAINENSVIYHKVSASSGGEESEFSIKWGTRNRLIFINKYQKYTKGIVTYSFFYLTRMIKFIRFLITGKFNKSKSILEGLKLARNYLKDNKKKVIEN